MENPLLVFISSVINKDIDDLTREREAAKEVIQSIELTRPWRFEDSSASSELVDESYLNKVRQCDIFILILGKTLSNPVRTEYNTASDCGKPRLVFLKKVISRERLLKRFINDINVKWTEFTTPGDLQKKIKEALVDELLRTFHKLKLAEEVTRQRVKGKAQQEPILRISFDHLIETHTRLFAGRESFLQAITNFIKTNLSGYIFVEALSGYGKTSLLAKLVQNNPHFAYHFISQAYKCHGSDFDSTEMQSLLLNLCEQLETEKEKSNKNHPPKARFHGLLRSSPSNGPRVVVIDAVDEVDRHPNYLLGLLPRGLPPGVFLILSARKLGDRNYLAEIGLRRNDIGLLIDLPGLDEKAIAQLLRIAGGKAFPLADSQSFVKNLHLVSNGDPFYLRFLVEDVTQGITTPQNIDRTPSGLNEYLDIQLSILDRSAYLPQQRDILGLILEANGPLSRRDLINMVEGLDGLNFDNVIRDIHRFLLVYEDMYTFCHSRFKEYFASEVL